MEKTDIVVRWVDDRDEKWIEERERYKRIDKGAHYEKGKTDISNRRYRDWGLLKYWFRGIEKYAPWANNIYFVTCNQKPNWLNASHPKLKLVNHEDFIPKKWLPTFSSRTIDFNIFRIPELSNQFVFFDDDMFLIRETDETDFFINGIPRDSMIFNAITPSESDVIDTNIYNDIAIINKYFTKSDISLNDIILKLYNIKYGKFLYKNIVLSPWKKYIGFQDFHIPASFLKDTYIKLWDKEKEKLEETCKHKFRKTSDVNQWLIRYWQLAELNFIPRKTNFGKYYELSDDNSHICDEIKKQKTKVICINEGNVSNFEKERKLLEESFELIFPCKSKFEL